MKTPIYLLFLLIPLMVLGQSQDQNYKVTKTYKAPSSTATVTPDDITTAVQYFDGLGRPVQTIAVKAGGNGQDIIVPVIYEPGGSVTKQYLPYVDTQQTTPSLDYRDNTALVTSLNSYYQDKFPGELSSTAPNPYSEVELEQSPLGRTLQIAAPGKDWSMANGSHTQKIAYDTNRRVRFKGGHYTGDAVYDFTVGFTDGNTEAPYLVVKGFYPTGSLYKKIIKDENWTTADNKDKTIEEFTDKQGKLILKRTYNNSQPHDTYYVYDKFANLTYVIPPLAADGLVIETPNFSQVGRNYPWVRLARVDQTLSEEYEKVLSSYENSEILNLDLIEKYGGQGGFTVNMDMEGNVSLGLNITANDTLSLRTGIIADLSMLGPVKNQEIGKIEGSGYGYYFLVVNGNLEVSGKGEIPNPNLNLTLTGGTPLEYSKNYPWTRLCKVDPGVAKKYENAISGLKNSEILNTYTANEYGAQGGIAISIDEEDTVTVSLNISAGTPLELLNGIVFPLDIYRRLANRDLGTVTGTYGGQTYNYELSILDNALHIKGWGQFGQLNLSGIHYYHPTYTIDQATLEGLCYIYHYDKRDRLIEKKIPGKGWEYIVYDRLDRVVAVQDQNLKLRNYWLFTRYDKFSRVAYTGRYTNTATRAGLQEYLDGLVAPVLSVSRNATGFGGSGISVKYDKDVLPNTDLYVHTVNYYDDYNFPMAGITVPSANHFGETRDTHTKGLPTGVYVRTLDTYLWAVTVTGYDIKGRAIWSHNKNAYLSTENISDLKLDFTGKPTDTRALHKKTNKPDLVTADHFEYDGMGRLLRQSLKTGNSAAQLIVYNKYDEMGQLESKKVGDAYNATASYAATAGLQTIDYDYNIRGWLKGINDTADNLSTSTDLFAFTINYNSGAAPLYNGNISETYWKSKTDNKLRSYNYEYDDLNRVTTANYVGNYTLAQYPTQTENYKEGPISYDKNGNIKTLERWGLKNNNTVDKIDVLSYSYFPQSNQLRSVTDAADRAGFNNQSTSSNDDYKYDLNGNLLIDLNKPYGTVSVHETQYNYMNLPVKVYFATNRHIQYVYDATGAKLEKKVTNGTGNVTVTQYDGGYVYKDGGLQFFPHAEGYVTAPVIANNGSGSQYARFEYIYQYKDHLGNVRLSYLKDEFGTLQVIEQDNYYAFGMKHAGYNNVVTGLGNATAQKYEYNSKEYQDELGFNMYDYGARNYDATLGRWMNIDPLAERHYANTPYMYCNNNPVVFIDPDGMDFNLSGQAAQDWVSDLQNAMNSAEKSGGQVAINWDSPNSIFIVEKSAYDAFAATAGGGGLGGGGAGDSGWSPLNKSDFLSYLKKFYPNLNDQVLSATAGEIFEDAVKVFLLSNPDLLPGFVANYDETTGLPDGVSNVKGYTDKGIYEFVGNNYVEVKTKNVTLDNQLRRYIGELRGLGTRPGYTNIFASLTYVTLADNYINSAARAAIASGLRDQPIQLVAWYKMRGAQMYISLQRPGPFSFHHWTSNDVPITLK